MSGAPDLKSTQVYPPGYGEALVNEWEYWTATGQIIVTECRPVERTNNNGWDLGGWTNVETFMSGAGFVYDAQIDVTRFFG